MNYISLYKGYRGLTDVKVILSLVAVKCLVTTVT